MIQLTALLLRVRQPRQLPCREDGLADWRGDAVEVRRRTGGVDGAVLVDERVPEPARDGRLSRVRDLLDDAYQQPWRLDRGRDEHGPALKRPVPLADRLFGDGIVQGVARGEEISAVAVAVEFSVLAPASAGTSARVGPASW